jgi:hypothetical protein
MWWSDLGDLFTFYEPTSELPYISMSLNGVSQSRQEQLVAVLRSLMISETYENLILALIVDLYGYSEVVDWTDRLLHGLRPEDPLPEFVLFSTALPAYTTLDRDHFASEPITPRVASLVTIQARS